MSFQTQLLEHYHMTMKDLDRRCQPGSFSRLSRPDSLPSFQAVIARLEKAISRKEKTILYGDYDVDGLTSTSILKMALDERGLKPGFFIPNRYREGYGLNGERVKQFKEKGYHLIVCVDNGINAKEAVDLAHSLGMEVIAIDHHEPSEEKANLDLLFHDRLSGFLDYPCSAASLAYFVATTLLQRDDEYFATLAGCAVFSDVMPLVGNNLEFAKLSLLLLRNRAYPNLMDLVPHPDVSYEDITFSLIPALNSVGRIEKDEMATINACRFLLTPFDKEKSYQRACQIKAINEKKKEIVKNIVFDKKQELESSHGFVTVAPSYSGLSGLFAGKLLREKNVPVLVLAPEDSDPDLLVGSIRAPLGYKFDTFLSSHSSLFKAYGGHARACGVTFEKRRFYSLATLFLTECEKQALENTEEKEEKLPLTIEDLNKENYDFYCRFFPFGEGFPAPTFALSLASSAFSFTPSGKLAYAFNASKEGKAVCFSSFDTLRDPQFASFLCDGELGLDTYQGDSKVVFRIRSLKGEKD